MFLTAIVVFLLDFFSKWLVQQTMGLQESIPLIRNVFHITYIHNRGAAFGILQQQTALFIAITVVVLLAILWYHRQLPKSERMAHMALGLIFGGSVGNLIDRIRWGYVIDWLDFRIWPIFNLADSAIVIGGLLLAWMMLTRENPSESSDA